MVFSYEDYLDEYGTLTYSNVGTSMMPLLRQGKDLFIASPKGSERLKVGDVVLYRRPPDKYVLHRIVEVRPDDYVILGDNCLYKEYGIREEDIIAVMTGFVRNGREYGISDFRYRAYSFCILHTVGLRVLLKRVWFKFKRIVRRIIK